MLSFISHPLLLALFVNIATAGYSIIPGAPHDFIDLTPGGGGYEPTHCLGPSAGEFNLSSVRLWIACKVGLCDFRVLSALRSVCLLQNLDWLARIARKTAPGFCSDNSGRCSFDKYASECTCYDTPPTRKLIKGKEPKDKQKVRRLAKKTSSPTQTISLSPMSPPTKSVCFILVNYIIRLFWY